MTCGSGVVLCMYVHDIPAMQNSIAQNGVLFKLLTLGRFYTSSYKNSVHSEGKMMYCITANDVQRSLTIVWTIYVYDFHLSGLRDITLLLLNGTTYIWTCLQTERSCCIAGIWTRSLYVFALLFVSLIALKCAIFAATSSLVCGSDSFMLPTGLIVITSLLVVSWLAVSDIQMFLCI